MDEITLDMTNNMRKIARTCFHNAKVVIVHFHVQKLALEAVQEERIRLRWRAIDEDNRLRKEAKTGGKISSPPRHWITKTRGGNSSSTAATCSTSPRQMVVHPEGTSQDTLQGIPVSLADLHTIEHPESFSG